MTRHRSNANAKGVFQQHMYTIGEAAKYLGIPLDTARTQRKHGNFPPADGQTEAGWDLWELDTLRRHLTTLSK